MALFIVTQKKHYTWFAPDTINNMLVRADTENLARYLCEQNESAHRDGAQQWDAEHATCEALSAEGKQEVIFVG